METRKKKEEMRIIFSSYRDGIPAAEREKNSLKIKERLFSLAEFKSARAPMFFVSFGSEVDTKPMIREALSQGKQVIVPRVDRGKKELELSLLQDFPGDLVPGVFGILEPKEERFRPVDVEVVDLVLVPGLAFGLDGYRIGYGGGYYDRLLEKIAANIPLVGLCFDGQVVEEVPHSLHDFPVTHIVSEEQVVEVRG